MSEIKIMYAGSDHFACQPLEVLIQAGYIPSVVLTNPDRKSGRGLKLKATSVKQLAEKNNIPTWTPMTIKTDEAFETFKAYDIDLFICVAYGKIIPSQWFEVCTALNIHPSLLPKWRGCSPVEHTILNRDQIAGVSIIQMSAEIDAGDLLYQKQIPVKENDHTLSLGQRLFEGGADLLIEAICAWEKDQLPERIVQNSEKVTYAPKIAKHAGHIDWNMPAEQIDAMVRAYYDWPHAYADVESGILKIFKTKYLLGEHQQPVGTIIDINSDGLWVRCQNGSICIVEAQLPGKKRMQMVDILRGNQKKFQKGMQI
ncbi:MAG: methionyl-tRNA formyltransferase [Legionellales bacterium]|nr:methionyl-tRNA formyltransferase [Legionellales bacterium]OUX67785.1 MAG: methionyl-tRNA formyltransferase [bacterium TMED178]